MFETNIRKDLLVLSMIGVLLGSVASIGQIGNINTAEAVAGDLDFIYSTEVVKDSTTAIAKKHLQNDTKNFAGQGYWQTIDDDFDTEIFDVGPNNRKMMFAANLETMKDAVPEGKKYGVEMLAYNAESHWDYTPTWEQNNPVEALNRAANIAHSNGYKFAYNPSLKIFRGPDLNYLKQDWTKVDLLILPHGGMVKNIDNFKLQTKKVVDHIKAENPNIEIYVFISLRYATPAQNIAAIDAVKTMVDGTAVSYHPDAGCTYCSEANLDKLLTGVV